jgi:septal ring factor EnvC (AmiA/AmiB activator)
LRAQELETRDASIARLGNDVTAQERLIAAVRAERDALDAAYKNERTTFRVALGALARESSQFEDVLALAHRSNTSLARARAEAEARATQMDSTMRSRLEDVTRALTAEARITEDLLVAGLDQTTAGRLTMRNFESDVSAVMPVSPSMGRRG